MNYFQKIHALFEENKELIESLEKDHRTQDISQQDLKIIRNRAGVVVRNIEKMMMFKELELEEKGAELRKAYFDRNREKMVIYQESGTEIEESEKA